jgi:hypothetical protein
MEKRHNYVRKVAEVAVQLYISNDKPNISGTKHTFPPSQNIRRIIDSEIYREQIKGRLQMPTAKSD